MTAGAANSWSVMAEIFASIASDISFVSLTTVDSVETKVSTTASGTAVSSISGSILVSLVVVSGTITTGGVTPTISDRTVVVVATMASATTLVVSRITSSSILELQHNRVTSSNIFKASSLGCCCGTSGCTNPGGGIGSGDSVASFGVTTAFFHDPSSSLLLLSSDRSGIVAAMEVGSKGTTSGIRLAGWTSDKGSNVGASVPAPSSS